MVKALLAGAKTQTRRILKPQPPPECGIHYMLGNESWLPEKERTPYRHHWEAWSGELYRNRPEKALAGGFTVKMRWAPGDLLWVRETWGVSGTGVWTIADARAQIAPDQRIEYAADGGEPPWWPSIHMPREFSRVTLAVTDVGVRRLQDISEENAKAEGMVCDGHPNVWRPYGTNWPSATSAKAALLQIWNHLHGSDAWSANPWVCAISFEVHKANVDAFLKQREAA
jgi:hypothetical protein